VTTLQSNISMKQEFKDYTLTWDSSPEAKQKCWDICFDWFNRMQAFNGESICQNDTPQIEAPYCLAKVAEQAFKFKSEWKE
jgi:hypothetical protein